MSSTKDSLIGRFKCLFFSRLSLLKTASVLCIASVVIPYHFFGVRINYAPNDFYFLPSPRFFGIWFLVYALFFVYSVADLSRLLFNLYYGSLDKYKEKLKRAALFSSFGLLGCFAWQMMYIAIGGASKCLFAEVVGFFIMLFSLIFFIKAASAASESVNDVEVDQGYKTCTKSFYVHYVYVINSIVASWLVHAMIIDIAKIAQVNFNLLSPINTLIVFSSFLCVVIIVAFRIVKRYWVFGAVNSYAIIGIVYKVKELNVCMQFDLNLVRCMRSEVIFSNSNCCIMQYVLIGALSLSLFMLFFSISLKMRPLKKMLD